MLLILAFRFLLSLENLVVLGVATLTPVVDISSFFPVVFWAWRWVVLEQRLTLSPLIF